MVMEREYYSSPLYFLSTYGHLATKCHILPQLKNLKGILPLYFLGPPFIFLTNCAFSFLDSKLEESLDISS
jgi:hypothetical protein